MKNIFNPVYRDEYFVGYSDGLNPLTILKDKYSDAYHEGFHIGRQEYESMNGRIYNGIPVLIVTTKVLEDFLLAGMLGMNISEAGYTPFQIEVIQKWYLSGVEKYDSNSNLALLALLEENEIELI